MPRQPWTDGNIAQVNAGLFDAAIEDAKRKVENSHVKPKRQMSYGGI